MRSCSKIDAGVVQQPQSHRTAHSGPTQALSSGWPYRVPLRKKKIEELQLQQALGSGFGRPTYNCAKTIPCLRHCTHFAAVMSNLKRKDAPGGHPPSKSAKQNKETGPSKNDGKSGSKKAQKPTASDETSKQGPVVSVLKEEEPLFARGGGSVLTPLEQKQIQLEAKADAMRDEEFNTGNKDQKKKKRKTALKSASEKKGDVKIKDDSVKVESLNFKVVFTFPSLREK
jgi:rRNA biogenesis protein RRP5